MLLYGCSDVPSKDASWLTIHIRDFLSLNLLIILIGTVGIMVCAQVLQAFYSPGLKMPLLQAFLLRLGSVLEASQESSIWYCKSTMHILSLLVKKTTVEWILM